MANGRFASKPVTIPLTAFVVTAAVSYGFWYITERFEHETVRLKTSLTAEQVAIRLGTFISERVAIAEMVLDDWSGYSSPTRKEFERHATEAVNRFGGLLALNWIDESGVIRWVIPYEENRAALDQDLTHHPIAADIIERARRTQLTQLTPPLDLYQGGRGIVAYIPTVEEGRVTGFLNAVFRIAPMVEQCLARGVADKFAYFVADGEDVLYASDSASPREKELAVSAEFPVGDRTWTVTLIPTPALVMGSFTRSNDLTLVLGLLLAATIALLIWRLLVNRVRIERRERMYRGIVDTAREGIWTIDERQTTTFVNGRMGEILGYRPEEMLGRSPLDFMDETGQKDARREFERRRTEVSEQYVLRLRRKDGTDIWTSMSTSRLVSSEGRDIGTLALVSDISERRRAEEALRQSEERLGLALHGADLGLWDWDLSAANIVVNERSARMLGYSLAEVETGADWWIQRIHPDDRAAAATVPAATRDAGGDDFYEIEQRMRMRDGSWIWVLSRGKIVQWSDDGTPVRAAGTYLDITARKRAETEKVELEAQLRHTQKLESLGVLAGGIAHDFNNLLMGILGNASLAADDLPSNSSVHESLVEIETAATRAADLCLQLLAYSGRGRFRIEALDLNATVQEMGHLLDLSTSKRATIAYELADDVPAVEADATQIRQVVMNLITNAAESFSDSHGTITMRTSFGHRTPTELRAPYLDNIPAEGEYVTLEVQDDGCGMDDKTIERIFDPFFTTKFTGRGLGMAAVLGIVRGHDGSIMISSSMGRGTVVRVHLPALPLAAASTGRPAEARSPADAPMPPGKPATGNGATAPAAAADTTILVVDDEPFVLALVKRMLEPRGFVVLIADGGEGAIEIVRRSDPHIDCVLLDLTMPRMDGAETFGALHDICPGLPVVISSGYNEQEATGRFCSPGPAGFIHKPYRRDELLSTLSDALARRPA